MLRSAQPEAFFGPWSTRVGRLKTIMPGAFKLLGWDLPAAALAGWVETDWINAMKAKSMDGAKLASQARSLIAKYQSWRLAIILASPSATPCWGSATGLLLAFPSERRPTFFFGVNN